MAFVDSTSFTGKDLDGFFSTALIKGITKERIRLISDVKSKVKLASLNLSSNLIQAGACAFNDQGTATLAQTTLEVCDLMVNLQLCPKDFEVNYLSLKQRAGSNNSDIPADFQSYFLDQIAKGISAALELNIWQGNPDGSPISPTGSGVCQGLLELFDNDATVLDVTGTTLSASNIVAEINKVIDKLPNSIVNDELVLFISPAAGKFYAQAQATVATGQGTFFLDKKAMTFLGYEIVVAPGLPANVMVMTHPQNLWYGTDLVNDENEISIIDMSQTTGDKYVRFRTDFKFGVNYGVGAEVVYYH